MHQPLLWNLGDATPTATLREQGFVRLTPARTFALAGVGRSDWWSLARHWNDLPADPHLRDGGSYRFRRHASLRLTADGSAIAQRVERAH